jgi:hypothetical protein
VASFLKNIEHIKKHFDVHSDFIIKKISESNIPLGGKSTKNVNDLVYPIVHLIDFKFNGDSSSLTNKSLKEITSDYFEWHESYKKDFTTFDYIEKNDVILDYRKNGVGYYWVDLNCYYSSEMLIRLNNCGRVNSYQNFLELREYDSNNSNYSRVVVVINHSGHINQIRGDYNMKPSIIYRDFIYDLFLNYEKLKGFKFLFTKETDFTHMDLSKEQLNTLKKIRPELFGMI